MLQQEWLARHYIPGAVPRLYLLVPHLTYVLDSGYISSLYSFCSPCSACAHRCAMLHVPAAPHTQNRQPPAVSGSAIQFRYRNHSCLSSWRRLHNVVLNQAEGALCDQLTGPGFLATKPSSNSMQARHWRDLSKEQRS